MEFTEAWENTCSAVGVIARIGNSDELCRLIENEYPVDVADNRGWRPLHEAAAKSEELLCLEKLLKHKDTDVNWQTHEGETALLLACKRKWNEEKNALEAIKLLLKYNADLNIADNENETPLMLAIRSQRIPVILELLNSGSVDPNKADCGGWSPLHEAAMFGFSDVVILLLKIGAKIDMQDECGITPIFTAAQHGKLDCLKILLDAAREKSAEQLYNMSAVDGTTPIMIAAQQGFTECVQMLISYGANSNCKALDDVTAIHLTVQGKHVRCLELLLDNINLDSFTIAPAKVASPLHLAVDWHSMECLKLLLERGFPINSLSERTTVYQPRPLTFCLPPYETALSYAIQKENSEAIDIFLESGANCNAVSDEALHPLILAISKSSIPLINRLIECGSDVNYQRNTVPSNEFILIALKNEKLLLHLLLHGANPSLCFPKDNITSLKYFVDSLFSYNHSSSKILKIMNILLLFTGVYDSFQMCMYAVKERNIQMILDNYEPRSWTEFFKKIEHPSKLIFLCRLYIRRHLSKIHRGNLSDVIHQLTLPKVLTTYLLYEDSMTTFE